MISLPARVRPAPSVALPAAVAVVVTAGSWVAMVRFGAWLGISGSYPLTSLLAAGFAGAGTGILASLAIDVARIARNRRR